MHTGKEVFITAMTGLKRFTIILTAIFLAALPSLAQTPDQNVFSVSGVKVDVSAGSASDARNIALIDGQREAFSKLYRKLVAEEDWAYEPTLANDQLTPLIQSFEVRDERTSDTRYIATLDVSFDPENMRELLGGLRVSFAETRTKPTLVLPLLTMAGTDILWGQQNIWLDAWRAFPTGASLIHYIIPNNDLNDQRLLSPRHLLSLRPDRIKAHLDAYETSEVLVVHAKLQRAGLTGSTSLNVKTYRGVTMAPLFEILVTQQKGEDLAALLNRAVSRIDSTLSEAWKAKVLIQYGSQENMQVHVDISDYEDWRDIFSRLEAITQIRSLNVESLAFDQARLSFDYYGGIEQLQVALGEQSLALVSGQDGSYEIKRAVEELNEPISAPVLRLKTGEEQNAIQRQGGGE
ncbi:MAG: DUF2066 domain-containing protein [Sphingomonadales bacterium]